MFVCYALVIDCFLDFLVFWPWMVLAHVRTLRTLYGNNPGKIQGHLRIILAEFVLVALAGDVELTLRSKEVSNVLA